MTRIRRHAMRGLGTVAAATALTMAAGGSAWAHECYNASRSAQGDAAAGAHSAAWEVVTLNTIVTVFLGQTQEVAACVEPLAMAAGVPDSFVFGNKQAAGQDFVIAEKNPNMIDKGLASDGRGIDHAAEVYGETVVGLILQCGGSLG